MASVNFPPCPVQLKTVQHYLKLAKDYDQRDPIIAYWSRLYALQSALKIDRKSPEARALLTALMDYLEKFKKEHADNDAVISDVAAQAIIENEAHKLFSKADAADRQAHFDKNIVKTFYTAGILMDVVEVFGALSEEIAAQRKYAKWKATYIHNCLKEGKQPEPGPIGGDDDDQQLIDGINVPNISNPENDASAIPGFNLPNIPADQTSTQQYQQPHHSSTSQDMSPRNTYNPPEPSSGLPSVTPEQLLKAQKYCKYAASSLDYEDAPTAIDYLQKALSLLTTGNEV